MGVMQPQRHQGAQVVALLVSAVNGVFQADGVPHIGVVKGDVVIAHQHQFGVGNQLGLDPVAQALEPVHLVVKFV